MSLKARSKWGIDGVFSDMRIEKKGDKFSRELNFWLISILWLGGENVKMTPYSLEATANYIHLIEQLTKIQVFYCTNGIRTFRTHPHF